MKPIFEKEIFLSWIWVGLCSIAIFLTIPVARSIQRFVSNNWGRKFFGYFVLSFICMAFIILLYFLIYKLKIRFISNYIWLLLIAVLYTYFTLKLWKIPEEAIHFLEYGLLSFFLFKALSHNIRDRSIYITAALFALLIGTFDEIIQWMIPRRVWNFRDVGLNLLSGGLFQLAVWKVLRPKIISEKFNTKSLKIFTSVFASCLIILGLCVSNTPDRVYRYTKKIPWLSFLQKEEAMSEFGYKHKDPEIGMFYSRLSIKSLQKTDNHMGEQYAQILNESIDKDYEQFIREYSPTTEPFMHELRVHIFRRDTYLTRGKSTSKLNDKKEFYFIAYKENLILEKYFRNSVEKSIYRWNNDVLHELEKFIDKSKHYESPVSANLFTSFSEKTVWVVILSAIFLLAVANLIFPLIEKRMRLPRPLGSQ